MTQNAGLETSISHADPIAPVIFGVTLILIAALIGRYGARHLKQPSVLGELIMGLLLGNVLYFLGFDLMTILREGIGCTEIAPMIMSGVPIEDALSAVLGAEGSERFLEVVRGPRGGEYLAVAQAVDVFSRYGVIFLLFHVGLDTCVDEMRQVGADSLRVAAIGVLAPFALGYSAAWLIAPGNSYPQNMFLGATLGATSIGITARVLHDLNQSHSGEAHVIVGAAVFDDVLGLVMLAVVSGIVVTGGISLGDTLFTILHAALFIGLVLALGPYIIRALIFLLRRLSVMEAKLFVSFIFVMALAWTANLVGLASIVGAFAAGLLLLDSQFQAWGHHHRHKYSIKELFAPIESVLAPIFFVLMGIQVKFETFLNWEVITLAAALILAAVAGKVVAGVGAGRGLNRWAIGVGMLPRGEVGLVFASIGRTLEVIDSALFSAVVLMVIVTTLITPPLLKVTFGKGRPGHGDRPISKLCE